MASRVQWEEEFDAMIASLQSKFKNIKPPHRLGLLDRAFGEFHETRKQDVSYTMMKSRIKKNGICLSDCVVHGSPRKLNQAFRRGEAKTVPLKRAKKFEYVKAALITL